MIGSRLATSAPNTITSTISATMTPIVSPLAQVLVEIFAISSSTLTAPNERTVTPSPRAISIKRVEVVGVIAHLAVVGERELHQHGVAVVGHEPVVVERTRGNSAPCVRRRRRAPR